MRPERSTWWCFAGGGGGEGPRPRTPPPRNPLWPTGLWCFCARGGPCSGAPGMPLGLRQLFLVWVVWVVWGGVRRRRDRPCPPQPPPVTLHTRCRSVVPELGNHFPPGLASPSGGPKFGGGMDSGVDRWECHRALGTAQNQPRCPAEDREDRRRCWPLDQAPCRCETPPPLTTKTLPCSPGARQHRRKPPVVTGPRGPVPSPGRGFPGGDPHVWTRGLHSLTCELWVQREKQ